MKTTKKQYDAFISECKLWIKEFGLLGWRFYFEHKNHAQIEDCIAWIEFPKAMEDRVFTIGLSAKIDFMITDSDILRSAFHEVCEALLHRIERLGKARITFDQDIDEEKHNLIRILENVIWDARISK